jgi:hypothetical protein
MIKLWLMLRLFFFSNPPSGAVEQVTHDQFRLTDLGEQYATEFLLHAMSLRAKEVLLDRLNRDNDTAYFIGVLLARCSRFIDRHAGLPSLLTGKALVLLFVLARERYLQILSFRAGLTA